MPNYNKGELLKDAVHSWENQTCKDFELIIVDDGSDSPEGDLLDYVNHPWIRPCPLYKNHGPAYARHIGESIAQSDIILRADSDDIALPDRVELTLKTFDKHPETTFFHADSINQTESQNTLIQSGPFKIENLLKTGMFFISGATVAYRKSIHKQPFNTNISSDEWMFYYDVICNPETRIRYLKETLSIYKTTENNLKDSEDRVDDLWRKRKPYLLKLSKEFQDACLYRYKH